MGLIFFTLDPLGNSKRITIVLRTFALEEINHSFNPRRDFLLKSLCEMGSAYYNNNNFIVLILMFIYLFIHQIFTEYLSTFPCAVRIIGENMIRFLSIHNSQSKETKSNQTLYELE